MSTFTIRQGDYHRRLQLQLTGISTTGASAVTFKIGTGGSLVDRAGTIDGAATVSLAFQSPELDTVGTYPMVVVLTYADGTETVPTMGADSVVIVPLT